MSYLKYNIYYYYLRYVYTSIERHEELAASVDADREVASSISIAGGGGGGAVQYRWARCHAHSGQETPWCRRHLSVYCRWRKISNDMGATLSNVECPLTNYLFIVVDYYRWVWSLNILGLFTYGTRKRKLSFYCWEIIQFHKILLPYSIEQLTQLSSISWSTSLDLMQADSVDRDQTLTKRWRRCDKVNPVSVAPASTDNATVQTVRIGPVSYIRISRYVISISGEKGFVVYKYIID